MAQPVAVNQIVQVTPRYLVEGQQTENVWYFQCISADPDMLANLLLVIAQCLLTHLLPVLAGNVTLESVRGKIVGPAVGGEDEWTPEVGDHVLGGADGDAEPSFVAAVVSLYTHTAGRSGRGRTFIAGIPESDTTGSLIITTSDVYAGIVATMACIAAAFPLRELAGASAYEWGMYSRKDGGVVKPPYPTAGFHGISRFVVRQELGTQRSRKLGRGK